MAKWPHPLSAMGSLVGAERAVAGALRCACLLVSASFRQLS